MAKQKPPAKRRAGGASELRTQSGVVRRYLEALERDKPKRGRRRTADSIRARLSAIEKALPDAPAIKRLQLVQERLDLTSELSSTAARPDNSAIEAEFVAVAKAYSAAKGITYAAWRELGVTSGVLRKAGVPRTRRNG
jgi:hypothetical protein